MSPALADGFFSTQPPGQPLFRMFWWNSNSPAPPPSTHMPSGFMVKDTIPGLSSSQFRHVRSDSESQPRSRGPPPRYAPTGILWAAPSLPSRQTLHFPLSRADKRFPFPRPPPLPYPATVLETPSWELSHPFRHFVLPASRGWKQDLWPQPSHDLTKGPSTFSVDFPQHIHVCDFICVQSIFPSD